MSTFSGYIQSFFKKHNIEEISYEYGCVRMSCRINNDDISILSTLDKIDTLFIMTKEGIIVFFIVLS